MREDQIKCWGNLKDREAHLFGRIEVDHMKEETVTVAPKERAIL